MRWLGVAAASAVAVAAITIALVLRDGSSGHPANRRVTVIIGAAQQTNPPPVVALALDGAHAAERDFGADVHVVYGGVPGALDAHGIRSLLERVASLSGLVYTPFIASDEIIARVAREFPQTRFVVGYQVESAPYSGLGNVTGITFSDRELGYLAGYLGALMSHRGAVSVVGGAPVPVVLDLVEGFVEGAHAANPSIRVLRGYSGTFDDQSRCEALAKHQIDAGSRVIFNAAGNCGFGALEAAGIRGVWGIGVDKDLSYLGPHILASAVKRLDRATELGIKLFLDDALPRGRTVVLDLSTDSVGLVGINTRVSTSVRQELLQVAAKLRRRDQQKASS
jgi:basic membrane lipoprotein Med (substrate-binding protein (PBP1-ABC) superfamily)